MAAQEQVEFIRHDSCAACGSRDNKAVYSDGHTYCFGCRTHTQGANDDSSGTGRVAPMPRADRVDSGRIVQPLIQPEDTRPLTKRGISVETCEKWDYSFGTYNGRLCQIAAYIADGKVVAQKLRFPDKSFTVTGDLKAAGLYGEWLWRDAGKMIVITEGEIDALTVSQVQGNKWPVVSVPNGAAGAKKAVAKSIEWLLGFESVIFMFDQDEAGRAAAIECAAMFPPGKAKIATLPLKDANEMLMAGRSREIVDAMWGAKSYRPDGIVTIDEVREDVLRDPEDGLPWFMDTLTKLTYGRRLGELYGLGAGTGVGKTDFLTQQVCYDLIDLKRKVGVFFLEQHPTETVKRIAGKVASKRFHIPRDVAGWDQADLESAMGTLGESGRLFLYNHFGAAEWDTIRDRMRFLARSEGVQIFYLDHLTALAADLTDERRGLDKLMAELGGLVKELNVMITFVSHLATPEGKPHEEGGRVMLKHLRGSRAIVQWAHYVFGLERNQQADDPSEATTTTFRVLKDRYTGDATGKTFTFTYNTTTGLLHETNGISFAEGEEGF